MLCNTVTIRGVDGIDPVAIARATRERHRRCRQVARFLVEDVIIFRDAQMEGLGLTVGVRETRRLQVPYRILLETYYLPGDLRQQIDAFVVHYYHCRFHESLLHRKSAE